MNKPTCADVNRTCEPVEKVITHRYNIYGYKIVHENDPSFYYYADITNADIFATCVTVQDTSKILRTEIDYEALTVCKYCGKTIEQVYRATSPTPLTFNALAKMAEVEKTKKAQIAAYDEEAQRNREEFIRNLG